MCQSLLLSHAPGSAKLRYSTPDFWEAKTSTETNERTIPSKVGSMGRNRRQECDSSTFLPPLPPFAKASLLHLRRGFSASKWNSQGGKGYKVLSKFRKTRMGSERGIKPGQELWVLACSSSPGLRGRYAIRNYADLVTSLVRVHARCPKEGCVGDWSFARQLLRLPAEPTPFCTL